jgi:uncharacterized protein (TIGR00251 family)
MLGDHRRRRHQVDRRHRKGGTLITARNGGVRFDVHVQPRASRSEIAGSHGDAIKIRLAAPPVDGAANDALIDFLANHCSVPKRTVRIVAGAQSRAKIVEIDGLNVDAARRLLNPAG